MKTIKDFINESILDSPQKNLSPKIWNNNKLKPSVKAFILSKLKTFLKAYTTKEPTNVFIIGSITSYQYTETSDIDVNFTIDVSNEKIDELVKVLPNGHNIPGTLHPVNYYVANEVNKEWKEKVIYDVLRDRWINEPKEVKTDNVFFNFKAVSEISRFFIFGVTAAISEYEMDTAAFKQYELLLETSDESQKNEIKANMAQKLFEIKADLDCIFIAKHIIKSLRRQAFESEDRLEIMIEIKQEDSDKSINNLIYKYLEKMNYLEKIEKILEEKEKWQKVKI